ncbi:MAG: ankyrin repeat domain-containing protein, partial [Deltaproteobacteria bacterium]|nr:ankyrin repeat domain-containing protein [Deltaproteobacteria bacterium]
MAKRRPRTFISYRRDDSAGHAGRLYDRFVARFGKGNVFRDVDVIGAGADFVAAIQQNIAKADVFIAVIGPQWLSVKDDEGRARLSQSDDLVRLEIVAALDRGMQVIPILIQGAGMPTVDQLPQDIAGLARRNAVTLRETHFDADVDELIRLIAPGWVGKWVAAVAAVVVAAVAGVWWLTAPPSPEQALAKLSAMDVPYRPAAFVEAAGLDGPISADLVELLLIAGMDPDAKGMGGLTAGATAARKGNLAVIELLIRENADPDRPFETACGWGQVQIVDFFLSKHPSKEAVNRGLRSATQSGHQEIVRKLLDHGAEVNPFIAEGVTDFVSTPLMAAAWGKEPDLVRLFLARGADPKAKHPATGWTALHSAAQARSSPVGTPKVVAQLLLDAGAEIDAAAQFVNEGAGWTPLLVALAPGRGEAEVAKLLIDAGANVNVVVKKYLSRDETSTALRLALRDGNIELVRALLNKGANANGKFKTLYASGDTPLIVASRRGPANAIPILLEGGAQIDTRNNRGTTALMVAAAWGRTEELKALLSAGAQVNAADNKGRTALILAAMNG